MNQRDLSYIMAVGECSSSTLISWPFDHTNWLLPWKTNLVGGDWNMTLIFPLILGMSSSQLTFIFFRGGWNHQPYENNCKAQNMFSGSLFEQYQDSKTLETRLKTLGIFFATKTFSASEEIPPGKRLHNYGKSHIYKKTHYQRPFSLAMLVMTRG